jgi:DNA polymerase-3 subunit alpha
MEYIPSFINRKHGTEDIEYDLPAMEEYLAETYGITVYQEQVMLLSQKLADFTKGEADVLRKAMGKKQIAVLDKMKPKFVEQASANGHDEKKLEKIWKDWEAFASYAFNKSHSTCYAWIAYQTAYLKAHYPAEYMASVLSNNMKDIKAVSFFMEECKRMELPVFGPDLNESFLKFSVNQEGAVRFGMAAVKGVGAGAVKAIIKERKENGNYSSIFDLAKRVNLRAANKKSFDSLIKAGAFDSFTDTHRAQYFETDEKGITFLERAMKFGSKFQENENSAQVSMFGEASNVQFPEPDIPECETWGTMELLSQEKEVIGIYISAHPLDDFKNEMTFCNASLRHFKNDISKYEGANLTFAAIITDVQHRVSKAGKGWAMFTMEDYGDSNEFRIFGEDYLRMKHFLTPNSFLFVRCTIQPGWTNKEGVKGEPRLKFTDFKLLHDIMDELCKKVTIKIPLQEIKEDTILNLETILKNSPGKQNLHFTIWDAKEKIEVSLPSRNTKIHISNELLATLKSQEIDFKLN